MSAPTKKTPIKRAAVKRSPRAAKPRQEPAATPEELSPEDLEALTDERGEEELADGEIRPVIIGKRGRRGDTPVQMVTLFELDDVPYQIPRNPSAALVLSWMLDVRKLGTAGANEAMGVQILGEGPLRALAASAEVQAEDLADIFTNIGTVFFSSENFRKISGASDPS